MMWRVRSDWSVRLALPALRVHRCGVMLVPAILTAFVVLGGCGTAGVPTTASPSPRLMVSPTPPVPSAQPLAWTPERLPADHLPPEPTGFADLPVLGAAPSDSALAYA